MKINELMDIIQKFLHGSISITFFCEQFDFIFLENEQQLINETEPRVYSLLYEIFTNIDFYEPNPLVRQESKFYLNEKQLLERVRLIYRKIICLE